MKINKREFLTFHLNYIIYYWKHLFYNNLMYFNIEYPYNNLTLKVRLNLHY